MEGKPSLSKSPVVNNFRETEDKPRKDNNESVVTSSKKSITLRKANSEEKRVFEVYLDKEIGITGEDSNLIVKLPEDQESDDDKESDEELIEQNIDLALNKLRKGIKRNHKRKKMKEEEQRQPEEKNKLIKTIDHL